MDMIGRGAEATILLAGDTVIKRRLPKRYRHPAIDASLRMQRTRAEARIIEKASKAGVPVPRVAIVDETDLELERVEGPVLKEVLDSDPSLAKRVGEIVALLHDANLIHADLTTSNMIVRESEIVLIDFGLSYHSVRIEDKAVDLHLFFQSLESKHHTVVALAKTAFLEGYRTSKDFDPILQRLHKVEARGRNKGS